MSCTSPNSADFASSQPTGACASGQRAVISTSGQSAASSASGESSTALAQMAPQFLGDERRERVQQPQRCIQHTRQHADRLLLRHLTLHLLLGDLHVPVGKVGPEELVDLPSRFAVLE